MAAKRPSRRAEFAAGFLVTAAGIGLAALAASYFGRSFGMIAGCTLVFLGAILIVPERHRRMRAWCAALMITSIALLLDWIALGRAPAGTRTHFWEAPGRVLLASGAALFTLMALWAWMRALWGGHARPS
jgi:hypothetical protein